MTNSLTSQEPRVHELDLGPVPSAHDAEALFKEARRRRRRRWLYSSGLVLLVSGLVGTGVAISQGGGQGRSHIGAHRGSRLPKAPVPPAPLHPPGVVLPSSGLFSQISVADNGLLLTGVTRANGESPESSSQSTCVAGSVDPQSLKVGHLQVGSCGDPLLFGRTAEMIDTENPRGPATVSVNTADPATGRVTEGPVLMTYEPASDTHPVVAYGTQWLWIYDVMTTNGPELLQVSNSTGEVVDTVPMPALYRPLLAADSGGVWVGSSIQGSGGPALSYVATGASAPRTYTAATHQPVCWLQAEAESAWVGAGLDRACVKENVERFADGSSTPVFSIVGSFAPFTVVGNETSGLWTMQWPPGDPEKEQIIHIDPDTGRESVVATLPSVPLPSYQTDLGLVSGEAVFFEGSLYLLEPPYLENGYIGYSSIVRVTPSRS